MSTVRQDARDFRAPAFDGSYHSTGFRILAFVLAVLVGGFSLSLIDPSAAKAVTVEWGTNGGADPNYEEIVNGDFVVAGNGVLACQSVPVTGAGSCLNLHAASNADADNVNDNAVMVNSNTVAGFTTNSSSALVQIPAGATVTKAFLNWSSNTGTWQGDARALCTTYNATRGIATLPSGVATGYRTQAVQLKVGSGSITSFAPASLREDASTQATTRYYSASADVTSAFASVPTGSNVTVSAGNIWAPTGAGCYAGWALTVVYDFGAYIIGNVASTPRKIIYYEGHVREGASDAPLSVAFNDFTAVAAGTRAGFSLYEGDRNITGDVAAYARGGSTTYTNLPNSAGTNTTDNIGIGRAAGSVRYTQTADTSAFTNQSVDVADTALTNVIAGDSVVNLRLGTSGDSYLLTSAVLSVPVADLVVTKTYNGTADTQYRVAGEVATFTITLTNSGAGTLTNIQVVDDQSDCSRTLAAITLLPTASTTFTCTAAAPTTAGYTSTATATARTVVGNFLATGSDSTVVALSAISLTKTSALAAGATGKAGDILNYSFTATNTGQGPLTGVTITDPLAGLGTLVYAWPGAVGALAVGQSVVATAPYTLTQANVDAGSISNTASTTGTDLDAGVKPTASATRVTPITPAPAMTLTKTGAYTTGSGAVNSVITYTFTAVNTGNVTLTGVAISDPLAGLGTITYGAWPSGTTGRLRVGDTITATATYTVKQSDVDTGRVQNTATVNGTTPQGATTTATSTQSTVATVAAAPALAATKTAAYTTGTGAVGSVITYTFTARNSGNVTMTGVTIADPLTGLSALTYSWPGTAGTLAPGATVTATATYTLKQSDVDTGSVTNRSTVSGASPTGTAVTTQSPTVVTPTAASAPATTLTKTGVAAGQTAGSVITYTFVLRNTGNVTLTGATIADPLSGLSAITFGTWPSGATGTLRPGDQVTATATYALKQSDVDSGSVVNTATSTANPPTGAAVTRTTPATVPITPTGTIAVTKTGAYLSGTGAVGSVIRFSITFRNTGNVSLSSVALSDNLAGLGTPVITWPATAGTLAPNAQATATADYTVTQADVDAGSVKNTATVTGRTPQGATVTGTSAQASVPTVTSAPAVTVVKTGAVAGGAAGNAGDVMTYTFVIRNTGNVTLTTVGVTDPLAGLGTITYTWPGTAGTLAPNQTATGTASYTIKQTDVDAGRVQNTATARGTSPTNVVVTGSSGVVNTPTATAAPAIVTTKTGALATGATGAAGDVITWTITLRNSGNVTLTGVAATDSLAGISALTYTWPGTAGTLAPTQTATATGTYTATQNDVDAGSVINTATGSGTPPTGAAVTSPGSGSVPLASRPTLSLTKVASPATGLRVGDVVTYTFVARNTGNVTISGATISDPLPGLSAVTYGTWPRGTVGRLQPGDQVSATATYTVTQANVDAGRVQNTATVTGVPPTGAAVTGTSPTVTSTTVAAAPALTTTKTAAYTTGSGGVGSVLTYTFTARNSGNVTLTAVSIADPLVGLSALAYTWPGTAGRLTPGQTVTATATYTLSQADVDRGNVVNRATSTGTPPTGAAVTAQSPQVTTATATSAPALTFTKSGSAAGQVAGSVVTYTFTLSNSGNVTLTGAAITDPLSGLSVITIASWPSGTVGTLRPGDSVSGTATYSLKQTDVDSGSVVNTASATGTPPTGAAVTRTASATVPITPGGALTVTKTGAYLSGTGAVGSVIRFTIPIRNSGNVTLTNVALTDTLVGLGTPTISWPGTAGTLLPGATATATADYTVKQTDVDAGSVSNTASATGRTPQGATVSGTSAAAVVSTAASAPAVSVVKTGVIAGGAAGNASDSITYTFVIRNTGNVTLTGVAVSDPLAGLGTVTYSWPGTAGTLAPNQTATGTASYTIKQADVDLGRVNNTATARGTSPTNVTVTGTSSATTTTAASAPAVVTTKSGALATGATGIAGDTINFSFSIRNSGNVTLTSVAINEALAGVSARVYSWPGAVGSLAPGQTATATATYTVTQADVDAGSVVNTVTGTGTPPTGAAATGPASASVALASRPALSLTKSASPATGLVVGTVVTYTFVARNTGNVTLNGVTVTDPLPTLSAVSYGAFPSGTNGRLRPGDAVTATATYTVTQADVDAGRVQNTATVTGTPPTGAAVTAQSPLVTATTVASAPSLVTTKSAAYTTGSGAVGSVLTYSFSARNSGNVTLTVVGITDQLVGLSALTYTWPGTPNRLAPGATVTATATYTLTQADVDRGNVVNRATAAGTPPTGAAVTAQSATVTTNTAASAPALVFTKSGSSAGTTAGSTVTYTFTLRNSGNVTLTSVGITDPHVGLSAITVASWPSGTAGTLRPNDQITGTATYALTQADVDSGSAVNTATATGTPPTGAAVTQQASATVPIASAAALSITKTAAYQSGSGAVGSVIRFSFAISNTGNVSVSNVAIADAKAGLSAPVFGTWTSGTTGLLRPGQSVTATALYTVTQADVNVGSVSNTASATGTSPTGATVTSATSTVNIATVTRSAAILAGKTATVSGTRSVGDQITYTLSADNTGNVTLTGVLLSDPMFTQAQLDYAAWPSGTVGTLQPGQRITATGVRTITQADVDTGSVTNTASATGTPPTGAAVNSSTAPVVTPTATRAPTISLTQTGALQSGSTGKVGDTVTWSFVIRNTGNVTLTGVVVAPGLAGAPTYGTFPSGTVGTLLPGQSVTATATSTLTQAQVDAGTVTDPATASGTGAGTTVTASTPATVTFTPTSLIQLDKSGSLGGSGGVGTLINYTFTVTNTGATTLTNVVITDPMPGLSTITYGAFPSGTTGTLRPGDVVTATATHTITQGDVDSGAVNNTATVDSKNPKNVTVSDSSDPTRVTTGAQRVELALTKTAAYISGTGGVGSVVRYTFRATNTGNITVNGVEITDPLGGLSPLSYSWPNAPNVLAPNATVQATATYTLVQSDVDRGYIDNRATVTGTGTNAAPASAQSPIVHTLTAAPAPALTMTKSGAVTTGTGVAGSTVTFSFGIRNTGNVTLTSVAISDLLPTLSGLTYTGWAGPVGTLAPNGTVSATATYVVTQNDVNAGSLVNSARVTGAAPTGAGASTTASAVVDLDDRATLTVAKTAAVTNGGAVGGAVDYTFVLRNTGSVTLTGVSVADPLPGLGTIAYGTWPGGTAGTLQPGTQVTATASYPIGQADVDRGYVDNQASGSAKDPAGANVTAASLPVHTLLQASAPSLAVTKTASIVTGGRAGDVVRYTMTVRNSGNVTLTSVNPTDGLVGLTDFAVVWPGTAGTLAPGAVANITANYRLTQADADSGSVVNTLNATGTPPTGAPVSGSASATTTMQASAPLITVTDAGALDAGAAGVAGDGVTWSYRITNTGNVTLTTVQLSEALGGATSPVFGTWPGTTGTLTPGQSVTATSRYLLTQANVDAGTVTSTITTTGKPPAGANVTSSATASVPIASRPSLSTLKSATLLAPGIGQVGDTVQYRLDITNTGNRTLYQGALLDPLPGLGAVTVTWPIPARPGEVPVGSTVVGTAPYQLTQADVDRGYIDNQADVEAFTTPAPGRLPANQVLSASNTVRVPTVQASPVLTVTKTGATRGAGGVGDIIDWIVTVRNTGNVTINGVSITDSLALQGVATTWPGTVGILGVGQTATLRGTTTITQANVDAGSVVNTGAATGVSSRDGAVVTGAPSTATVPTATSTASVDVTKTATFAPGSTGRVGDIVYFDYTLQNIGNVTLISASLSDALPLTGPIAYTWPTPTAGTLAPGATVTARGQYALTQADVDAGRVSSIVTGVGSPPNAAPVVRDTAEAGVTIASAPSLTLAKSGVRRGTGAVGDTIDYTFVVRNTGNVTLSLVGVLDNLAGVSAPVFAWPGAAGILLPNQSVTATATYTVTQADIDRGSIVNVATASGKPPVGDIISVDSPPATTGVQTSAPQLVVTKAATPTTGVTVGQTITYVIIARNSGNVTLSNVTPTDSLPGITPLVPTWPGTAGVLAPGQQVRYTTSYRATQADIDAGGVVNNVLVTAQTPTLGQLTRTAAASSTASTAAPHIAVTDSGALAPGATGQIGDVVTWTYTITNDGNVTLNAIGLTESQTGATAPIFGTFPGANGVLAPGQSVTATSRYTLTRADVDAGSVTSSISTRGTSPAPASTVVTATTTASVPIVARPSFTNVKGASYLNGGTGAVGDTIRYTLSVANTGNVTLYRGTLLDPLPGLGTQFPTWPIPAQPGTLPAGSSATGYADYTVTQADVDRGFLDNTATAAFFTTPTGNTTDNRIDVPSNTVRMTMVAAVPSLALTKTGSPASGVTVGDTITWTLTARNSGNVTLNGVTIADSLPLAGVSTTWGGGTAGTLPPGQSAVLTGTTLVTQANLDAGSIVNVASSSGVSARNGAAVVAPDAPATVVTRAQGPAITVTDAIAAGPGFANKAGDTVILSYRVTNAGNVTLSPLTLAESLTTAGIVWAGGQPASLAPGAFATATATHTLTQAEVDAGVVISVVTTTGKPPTGANVSSTASVSLPIIAGPSIATTKTGTIRAGGAGAGAGGIVDYAFTVSNTGNVTLTLVDLVDALGGVSSPVFTWPNPARPGVLLPGQTANAIAQYGITQADVDRGTVSNVATATGKPPVGDTISQTSNSEVTTVAPATPQLTVTKAVTPTTPVAVGATLSYSIRVQNTGNLSLTGVALTDPLVGLSPLAVQWPGVVGSLAPGAAATATATYRVTQADVDRGSIVNTASATGTPPRGPATVSASSEPVTSPTVAAAPAITVVDAGTLDAGAAGNAGDGVTWTYTITNNGNVTLTGVGVTEDLAGATAPVFGTWPGTAGTLVPGQSVTATSHSILTQTQVNAGTIQSTVHARGTSPAPASTVVTSDSTAAVPIASRPSIALLKTATLQGAAIGQVGDVIRYTLAITNTGNRTLYRGSLVDPLPGLGAQTITWPGTPGVHEPNTTVRGVADYVITQADVDRGFIENIAHVEEYTTPTSSPTEQRVFADSNRQVVTTVQQAPALSVTKTASPASGGVVGSTVTYTITTRNTGNVTVNGVTVSDPLPRLSTISTVWPDAVGVLAPGRQAVSTATYVLQQADIDTGSVTNQATASGRSARDGTTVVTGLSNSLVTPTAAATPSIAVTDDGALVVAGPPVPGQSVLWRYRVTNTGNVTLSSSAVSEALPGASAPRYAWTGTPGVLAPGAFVDVEADYPLTQNDIDAGSVISTVTAVGTPPIGAPANARATATVILDQTPSLTVTKAGALQTPGANSVGDSVRFSFTLTNRGNVTLRDVTLSDSLSGLGVPTFTWPGTAGVLQPGQSATAVALYQLTQTDLDAGRVQNQASASGAPPTGARVPAQSALVTVATAAAAPAVSVVKSGALLSGSGDAGSVVRFTFQIRNSGNVTLGGLGLTDSLAGVGTPVITWPVATGVLAPGATATGYADYTLTQPDVDRGFVDNTARVAGTGPGSVPVAANSNAYRFATSTARPELTTTQAGSIAGGGTGQVGEIIDYTFTIANVGNVTLSGVTFANTVPGLTGLVYTWAGADGVILPGGTATLVAHHAITQADVDAAVVRNVTTGRGTAPAPASTPVSDDAPELVIPLAVSADLALTKTGVVGGTGAVGDTITYTFGLTNSGTQTVTGASIDDGLPGVSSITYGPWPTGVTGVIPAGGTVTGTATYTITQTDVDHGQVVNTATATATSPGGTRLNTASSPATVPTAAAAPRIDITKTMTFAPGSTGRAGDVVDYRIVVTNTGNVTLDVVIVDDDQSGIAGWTYQWPGVPGILAPGESAVAIAHYTLTQADVESGTVGSTAATTASGVRGGPVSASAAGALVILVDASLAVTKTATPPAALVAASVIGYSITAVNTGNVALQNVVVSDPILDAGSLAYTWPGVVGELQPGQSVVATGFHTITPADVAAGGVANTATATGRSTSGAVASGSASASTAIPNGASVQLVMGVSVADGRPGYPGDTLIYRYVITNNGLQPITGVTLTDPKTGLSPIVFGTWPGPVGELQPGQSVEATAFYVITPADAGTLVTGTAEVTASTGGILRVVSDAGANILLPPLPGTRPGGLPGGLPFTGSDPTLPGIAAMLLVLCGLLFVMTARRRKESP